VTNQSGNPHNFHVHDVQFQISSYAEAPPTPALAGFKDTIFIPPHATVRFLVRFSRLHQRNLAVHVPLPPTAA
jgi:FtsP/CotA-like multicopper oxidase with cupredoxin domain